MSNGVLFDLYVDNHVDLNSRRACAISGPDIFRPSEMVLNL
jgi:hypothetical protein